MPDSDLIDDAGCWERYCSDYNNNCNQYKSQVRVLHTNAANSKGPTDARSKLSRMIWWDHVHTENPDLVKVNLQDFCMQIDSHMDFSDNYDTELIQMFHRTQNDYAVLSTYVASMEQNNQDVRTVPNLCMVEFRATIRNWGTKECVELVKPKLTNSMWGAGLSFHRCHAELNVGVDPFLDQVFDGEEGSRGLRFFTHGYDVYTPDRVLVTHDYQGHQHNPVVHTWGHGALLKNKNEEEFLNFMQDIKRAKENVTTIGTKRVNFMLGIGSNEDYTQEELQEVEWMRSGRFGLGTKRTLEQAMEFSGIDLTNRNMVANKCGNLQWVPYEESPNYGIDEIMQRGLTGGTVDAAAENVDVKENMTISSSAGLVVAGMSLMLVVAMRLMSRKYRKKRDRHKN